MDEMSPEPVHDLLLRLAGRVDDDLLADARELIAVGEDSRALELVTAALAADATPLPGSLREGLVEASLVARIDLDVDAALGPVGDAGDDHRFSPEAGAVDALAEALGTLPARRLEGCELRMSWRVTPAGAASGPLPQAVVLVRSGGHGPPDVLAYQMATALQRGGVRASVEVLAQGGPVPRYHAAAWRDSVPLVPHTQGPAAGGPGPAAQPDEAAEWDDDGPDEQGWAAIDDRADVPGNGHTSWPGADAVDHDAVGDGWTNGRSSWTDDRVPFHDTPADPPGGLFDDGRTNRAAPDGGGQQVDDGETPRGGTPRWSGAVEDAPGSADYGSATDSDGHGPAPRPLPMRPPGGRRRLVEQTGDAHLGVTPLTRGPGQGPAPIDRRRPSPRPTVLPQVVEPAEGSVPRPSRPDPAELTDTPTFAATHDALLGSGRQPPVADSTHASVDAETGTLPAHHRGSPSRPGSGPAGPGRAGQAPTRPGTSHAAPGPAGPAGSSSTHQAAAAPADQERAWAGEWTSGDWAVADPGPGEQASDGLLRPETVTRLSDADRDLLARLQAELVAGRRPRTGHQAEAGANGAHPDPPRDTA